MASKNYLVFDFGASNGRAAVANFDGKKFDFDVIHRFDNIPVFAAGTLYWDFLRLFGELKTGLHIASKKYEDIQSLGIDTWGVDFGIIDKNGKLISNPIHYRDEKRNSICDQLYKIISKKELFELTGCALVSYSGIFNLFALKMQDSPEFLNASKFLMMPDLFNYFLTGIAVNEYTDAHTSLMCNPFTKKWEAKITERLGFPSDIFCNIIQPGTEVGFLQKSVCDELDLKPVKVIAPASHDTPSAIAGIPVPNESSDRAFMSIGTWGINIIEMDSPIINSEIFESGFANEAGAEGKTLLFKNFVGMWVIQQCRGRWLKEEKKEISWDDIMFAARDTASIGSFINVDEPVFMLNQPDMPKMIRQYCSEKNQQVPQSLSQTARVIYESLALKVKHDIKILEKITAKKFRYLNMVGGGTKDKLLCQWVADATGLTVFAGPTETTSIGNLLMQLKAAGEIKNLSEGRQVSLNSSNVLEYKPANISYWDGQYSKYLKLL
ncbi:MAG: rhamnulokinase [Actinobacteria bacterium]|nr:rhamnulokinase [Actinomycetota bacterium]